MSNSSNNEAKAFTKECVFLAFINLLKEKNPNANIILANLLVVDAKRLVETLEKEITLTEATKEELLIDGISVNVARNSLELNKDEVIKSMKEDFIDTMNKSIYMNDLKIKNSLFTKFKRSLIRIFSPLL